MLRDPVNSVGDDISTIVSDGKGGIYVHLERNAEDIAKAGLIAHETVHIEDALKYAKNLEVLNDPSKAGYVVDFKSNFEFRQYTEIRGHQAAIDVWTSQLNSASQEEAVILNQRINPSRQWINAYKNPF